MPLGVAGRNARSLGEDPDLEEVPGLARAWIELGVGNPGARAHQLNLPRLKGAFIAHRIAVLELSFENVGKDFHVPVRVGRESRTGSNGVFVDYPQRAETHVSGVVVIGKRESVMTVQPTVVGVAALIGAANGELSFFNHVQILSDDKDLWKCSVRGLSMHPVHSPRSTSAAETRIFNFRHTFLNVSYCVMDLRTLHHFLVVAEEGGISAAARKVNLTQSSLSRQIKAMEDELGFELLVRSAHSVSLTPAGEVIVKNGTRILRAWDDAVANARSAGSSITLRIGYAPSLSNDILAPALERFRQTHPNARVSLFDQSTVEMRAALLEGKLDAMIGLPLPSDKGSIEWEELRQQGCNLAVPVNHPLAKKSKVGPEEIAEFPLLMFDKENYSDYWAWVTDYFKAHSLNAKIAGEFDGVTSMFAAVDANLGVGLVASGSRVNDPSRVKLIKVSPGPEPIIVSVGRCVNREPNPAVDVFVAEVKLVARDLQ